MIGGALLLIFCGVAVKGQVDLAEHFQNCRITDRFFDDCVKNRVNELTPYFKQGFPSYGIGSFDPFFAKEVPHKTNNPLINYKLVLRNVTEEGWTASQITKLKTDFEKNQVAVTQFFPDKRLNGWYEIDGMFLGMKIRNSGKWNLSLFDYVQTLTISRKQSKNSIRTLNPPVTVKCNIHRCNKLELHISNLAMGRTILENVLDRVINTAWQPGFILLSPIINDLVSTAFTEILNKDFQNFPFEQIFRG